MRRSSLAMGAMAAWLAAAVAGSACGSDESGTQGTVPTAPGGSSSGGSGVGGNGLGGAGATGGSDPNCLDVDQDGHCRSTDCADEDAAIHPGQAEACGNGLDDNCDGAADEGCAGSAGTFFVDKDSIGGSCSDSNPGSETAPWCTVAKANATLVAGDTVFVRAGTYANETIEPVQSGLSNEQRITYSAYGDEVVTFTSSVYCVRLQDTSYVTIVGLDFFDCERNLYLSGSSYNTVGYCTFDNPSGPATWAGSRIYAGSQYNRIYRSTFSRYGAESYDGSNWDDSGAVLDIGNDNEEDGSDHNLVTDSTFFYGGHHILGVYSDYNVVRNNTFHNEEWYPCHRPESGDMCGNRNVILNSSLPDGNTRNVIEDNVIAFSGLPPDNTSSAGLGVRTQYNIVRRNVLYDCDSSGISLSADGGNWNDASNNHVYHNVLFRNGYPLLDDWDPTKSGMMLARWVDDSAHNAMTGVAIKNNILHQNQLYGVYYYYVDEAEQFVEGNWDEQGDPGFVDVSAAADPFDLDGLDFHLAPTSPCIDGGVFLTVATNAGQGSTVLEVEDAGYFTAGHGLLGGDMVQLEGQEQAVAISAVDYDARIITVDAALTWEVGTGVSLPYFGAGPDQGAFEGP